MLAPIDAMTDLFAGRPDLLLGVLVFLVIVGIGVWGALHFLVPMLRR